MGRDFNSFFKELVQERIDEMPCPPKEEIWEQVKIRLRAERKKERNQYLLKYLRPVFAVLVTIVLFTVLFINFQTPVIAFTNKIIKNLITITDQKIKIHKNTVNTDEGSTKYLLGRDIDDPRIGEVQKKVHFRILIPEYIPGDFKLYSVDVLNKNQEKETVIMLYVKTENDNKKDSFQIMQNSFPNDSEITMNKFKDDNTKIEYIIINEVKCILITNDNSINTILWDKENISYEIFGTISRKDIIKVAESMK
jgi:hypothetical protein